MKYIRKHWMSIIIATLGIFIGVPVLANVLFKTQAPNDFFVAKWSAGEFLSYYGSVLSFIGTISLGGLALWQNHQFKESNTKDGMRNIAITNCPLLIFGDVEFVFFNELPDEPGNINNHLIPVKAFNGNKMIWNTFSCENRITLQLKLKFKNIGNIVASNLFVKGMMHESISNCNVLDIESNPTKYILADKEGIILLNIKLADFKKVKKEIFEIKFGNPFGSQYIQTINIEQNHQDKTFEIFIPVEVKIEERKND